MLSFLKNALFKGLIILIPLVLIFLTLRELVELMIVVATPIADMFPPDFLDVENDTEIIAALLIVATATLIGMLSMVPFTRAIGSWVEDRTIGLLPLYRMMKTLITAFLEMEDANAFRPALVGDLEGTVDPAYIIEDTGGSHVVVMVPWSPTSFAGSVKFVPRDKVRRLDLTLDEFSLALANFGLGMEKIVPHILPPDHPKA